MTSPSTRSIRAQSTPPPTATECSSATTPPPPGTNPPIIVAPAASEDLLGQVACAPTALSLRLWLVEFSDNQEGRMKRKQAIFAIFAGAALGVSCAPGRRGGGVGTVASELTGSSSKLGPHINNRGDHPHADRVLGACPRVAKWVLAGAQIQAE